MNRLVIICFLLLPSRVQSQQMDTSTSRVYHSGAMRNVMWKGELAATILLDTIAFPNQLCGIGPLEYLKGEIMLLDGTPFVATVQPGGAMLVQSATNVKAPFFVYSRVNRWKNVALPDSVRTLEQLESFLDASNKMLTEPFAFRVTAVVDHARVHIVNLPAGSVVASPDDAHVGIQHYELAKEAVEVLGFFSRKHQGIFIHHSSLIHAHLITGDRLKMGHLENAEFKLGTIQLYLPD
jgi:acetolactate decarboxylase